MGIVRTNYPLPEVATALGVSVPTLYRLNRAGKLAFSKIGRSTRVTSEELCRFNASLAQGASEKSPELADA